MPPWVCCLWGWFPPMGKGADTKSDERCPLGLSDTRLELLVVLIRDGHDHVVIRPAGIPIPAWAASRQAPLGTRLSMDDICRPTCPRAHLQAIPSLAPSSLVR